LPHAAPGAGVQALKNDDSSSARRIAFPGPG